jgi:hypothetical protein
VRRIKGAPPATPQRREAEEEPSAPVEPDPETVREDG